MDVSVIIVNYNTTGFLRNFLNSVILNTKDVEYEIIVVDNNSSNREIENAVNEFKNVRFFLRDENDGFGAACNFGVKYSGGKYLFFMNPDIIIESNLIYEFYEFMERNVDINLCSGLLTDFDGLPQYSFNNFPSVNWEISEAFLRNTENKINKLLDNALYGNHEFVKVDWVIGACMFMRKNIFESINGFDDNFFLYYEDVDLQYRINKDRDKIVLLPEFKLKHHQKSSIESEKNSDVYYYNMHLSKMKYLYKHSGFLKRNLIRIINISGMGLRLISLPFRSKNSAYTKQQILNILKIYFRKYNIG